MEHLKFILKAGFIFPSICIWRCIIN